MNLNPRAQMRLLLAGGVLLLVLTLLIVLYGFRRTEELRTEDDLAALAMVPRASAFGVPVGLMMGLGENPRPSDAIAAFDDGLTVTMIGIERQPCPGCGPEGQPVAVLRLTGGLIPQGSEATARVSTASTQWADRGYVVTLLDINPVQVTFYVELEGQVNP